MYWAYRPLIAQIDDRHCSMDQSSVHNTASIEEDEWDTEGFVIPSLGIENPDQSISDAPKVEESKAPPIKDKLERSIYLGPYGAPPQPKQQDLNPSNRKQRLKQKLKEADRRSSSTGRENKVESLRELVGGSGRGKTSGNMPKGSSKEWLDTHCDESLFDRRLPH